MKKPKMLTSKQLGNNTYDQNDAYHGTKDLISNHVWKEALTWEEAYKNYVQWYSIYYTKLGQVLK